MPADNRQGLVARGGKHDLMRGQIVGQSLEHIVMRESGNDYQDERH